MDECRVCGMLFLGGGACPSCGSQISNDLSSEVKTEDDMIPGLADAAASLIEEQENVQPQAKVLPFGMGAQAEILPSQLPFGVGSMTENIDEIEISNPEEEVDAILEVEIAEENEIIEEEIHLPEPIITPELIPEPSLEPALSLAMEPTLEAIPVPTPLPPLKATALPPLEAIALPPLRASALPPLEATPEPMRIQAQAVVEAPKFEVISEVVTEETPEEVPGEVPEMWRIDAEEADLESIYLQEDKIIEVTFADEFDTDEVFVQFDDFHHESNAPLLSEIENSPELHPASAIAVESDDDALKAIISSSFSQMGQGAWSQAAQILQAASAMKINHPPILNNLGLSILQNALEMDEKGVPLASSQYEAAIMALRQAAKIDSTNDTILLNLSHALLVSGRVEKAYGVITVLSGRAPENLEAANLMGACLIQMGRNSEARDVLMPHSGDAIVAANLARL